MHRESGDVPAVVARQGIYDSKLRLVAYELLFRPAGAADTVRDGDEATARVLLTAFSDVGLDALVGPHRAFVNIPYAFLTNGYCQTLPADRIVLEILEDVRVDDRVLGVARALVDGGHTLALDDFVFYDGVEPLVELADIVKLDVLALTAGQLEEHVERLQPFGVTLLAEKVEHHEEIEGLRALGFDLFQGFALHRPKTVRTRTAPVNQAVLAQILGAIHDADVSPAGLVSTVSRDPSIAFALLRILNSAHLSLPRKVTSLQQALVLLGIDGLRNWTTMMIMSRLAPDAPEALSDALIRAKMCELCAPFAGATAAVAFTVGLLSTLPETLDRTLEEVVGQLALSSEIRRALLFHEGDAGQVLAWVLGYEARNQLALTGLGTPATIATTYIDAVEWATSISARIARL